MDRESRNGNPHKPEKRGTDFENPTIKEKNKKTKKTKEILEEEQKNIVQKKKRKIPKKSKTSVGSRMLVSH